MANITDIGKHNDDTGTGTWLFTKIGFFFFEYHENLIGVPEYLMGVPEYLIGVPEYLIGVPEYLMGRFCDTIVMIVLRVAIPCKYD